MTVIPPGADMRWDYRRPAVEQIYKAVFKMLMNRVQTGSDRTRISVCQSNERRYSQLNPADVATGAYRQYLQGPLRFDPAFHAA